MKVIKLIFQVRQSCRSTVNKLFVKIAEKFLFWLLITQKIDGKDAPIHTIEHFKVLTKGS